jgi:inner membrane protein
VTAPLIVNSDCEPGGAAETAPLGVPPADASHYRTAWIRLRSRLLRPTRRVVLFVVAGFVVDQTAYQLIGKSVAVQAPLDWTAHEATTLLIIWALVPALSAKQLAPALVASVAIDVDHIPGQLGYDWFSVGTSRPYTHSLLTILVLLGAAALSDRRRAVLLGVALGVASHLWRDLAEPASSGVALFWPISTRTCHTPSMLYLLSIALLAVAAYGRATHRARLSAPLVGHP